MHPSNENSADEGGQAVAIASCPPKEANADIAQKSDGPSETAQISRESARESAIPLGDEPPSNPLPKDESSIQSIAQDGNESPAESGSSTKSGLVSPSSCSVSSHEQEVQNSPKEEELCDAIRKPESLLGLKTEDGHPTQPSNLTSTSSSNPSKLNVPLHTPSSIFKSPPIASSEKPDTVKSKSHSHRAGGRKRSNSVPVDPVCSASFLPSPAPSTSPAPAPSKGDSNLRRGKWTAEEESYVARVIQDFNNGFLNAPAGTTLRTFLSDKLNCDPMRITKKFTGDACIGKRVFHPAVRSAINSTAIDKAQVCHCIIIYCHLVA